MNFLAVIGLCLASACGSTASGGVPSKTVYVFAASSLTEAFGELSKSFEAAHPGIQIQLNFGGSQALRTQIEQGAPADVFVSASSTDMDSLISEGFIGAGARQILLTNRLVVILPANNPARIGTLEDLALPKIKLVLAAPDVPVGGYARQSLEMMNARFGADFSSEVLANVVSNEDNVKQVVAKIQLGEADAAIVYISDAVAAPSLKRIEIPSDLNVIAAYPIAVLKHSANAAGAVEFVDFAMSSGGQSILQKWGFGPAG